MNDAYEAEIFLEPTLTIINNNEQHYQAVMFTIFSMLGANIKEEEPTTNGRIDMVLKTDSVIYIFELNTTIRPMMLSSRLSRRIMQGYMLATQGRLLR